MSVVIKILVNAASTILLILPVILLYVLHTSAGVKIGILIIFVVAFSITLSIMTRATRHEVFAASAAYCAVLVIFLGNIPSQVQ